ncbi:hypothetical protein AMJ49_04585 [Parcubacteria bacterium DG_74_2]|nr:MAG: hypothetical protein AMJ49_04585 [Parcubacteria bacterium DG_74_2]
MENEIEKKIEFDKTAIRLLSVFEKENKKIKDFLINSYKGLPVSPEITEKFYNYFISHSVFSAATVANPSTSIITELLYDGIEKLNLPSPIDRYFLCSKAGRSIKARLQAIEEELPKIIEEYRKKGKVLIGNLGSGPGRDTINVLASHYRNVLDVKTIQVDKDKLALERGKRLATIEGVNHLIDFVEGNFLKYKPTKKFDIILFIGILCPLKFEICIAILKRIKRFFKKNGCLIASNVSKKMLKEDPFTCHLMSLGNWKMVFKDENELKQIFEKAGYEWKRCFTDSYGFNTMGVGTPRFYF